MQKHLMTLLVAFIGGMLGSAVYHSPPAMAQQPSQAVLIVGPDGRERVQIGTYPSAGERGLPLVGLFDNGSHLRLLLRLAGPQESPVLIFKDRRGRDRMVLGLGLNDEEPFLSTADAGGKKTNVFGHY